MAGAISLVAPLRMVASVKPNKAQQAYQDRARSLGCVVCRFRGMKEQVGATEKHHRNFDDRHGQKRLGEHATVMLCEYHHRGVLLWGWSEDEMREEYGPSYALHAKDFRAWTADALPDLEGKGTERWQAYYDEHNGEWGND